jgi:hypothetical protein
MWLFTVLRENARLGTCDAAASTLSVLNGCRRRRRRLRRSEFRRSLAPCVCPQAPLETSTGCRGQGSHHLRSSQPLHESAQTALLCFPLTHDSRDSYAGERFLLQSSHAARFTVCPDANRSAVTLVHDPSHQPKCDSRWPVVIASSQCPGARARQPPEPPHAACMEPRRMRSNPHAAETATHLIGRNPLT